MDSENDENKNMKILWLASWYPNPYEPVNGDFIQRHAQAVAQFIPLDVIHVVQVGKDVPVRDEQIESTRGNIHEMIHSFSFRKWGIGWIDKIRYQLKYRKFYVHLLLQYEKRYGRPALMHVHVPLKAGLLALFFKKRWKIPYIVSEQSSLYERRAEDSFDRRSLFFRYHTRAIFRGASLVTNVSASIGKMTDGELFFVISNGRGKMIGGEGDRTSEKVRWNLVNLVRSFGGKEKAPAAAAAKL